MIDTILFWMTSPPDTRIAGAQWSSFRNGLAGSFLLSVSIVAFLSVALYAFSTRRLKIRSPRDPFQPYWPMHWLWLALAPAIFLFREYRLAYRRDFPHSFVSPDGGALELALAGGVLTLLVAWVFMSIPGVTPARFRYRPVGWLVRGGGPRPHDARSPGE